MTVGEISPAAAAAAEAQLEIHACIDARNSFLVEAGAGAGKTFSLIRALRYVLDREGRTLLRQHQRIACITYTNVARDEIEARTDKHPAIYSATIHAFCWSLIQGFQSFLRAEVPSLSKWQERLAEAGGIGNRSVSYELGHPKVEPTRILLHHSDVLVLATKLFAQPKFCGVLRARFPIIFVDEYQDTDKGLADALSDKILTPDNGPLLGFFGDHWQKIYGNGCGRLEHPNLTVIGKRANFRSAPQIVACLNAMRPDLPQQVKDEAAAGEISIYHTNNWAGQRQQGPHWEGDLPPEVAHTKLLGLKEELVRSGWDFAPEKTKILMLTHNLLASEQGYRNLANVFEYSDSFIKKEDPHIAFLVDVVEPMCEAFNHAQFGKMFGVIGEATPPIRAGADKASWVNDMGILAELRNAGTIGAVMDHVLRTGRPRAPEGIATKENELSANIAAGAEIADHLDRLRKLREVAYREVVALTRYIKELTPFATKHGVKGAEFENVLVVIGRGWNQYNFNQFLEWAAAPPVNRRESFERNRNLFYVVCSRPKQRLAILFTQELSQAAIERLRLWFGGNCVHPLQE